MKSLSRRDFGKYVLGAAAVTALPVALPAENQRLTDDVPSRWWRRIPTYKQTYWQPQIRQVWARGDEGYVWTDIEEKDGEVRVEFMEYPSHKPESGESRLVAMITTLDPYEFKGNLNLLVSNYRSVKDHYYGLAPIFYQWAWEPVQFSDIQPGDIVVHHRPGYEGADTVLVRSTNAAGEPSLVMGDVTGIPRQHLIFLPGDLLSRYRVPDGKPNGPPA